jgi:nucleoside 2-deoxyribosyltransferase
MKRLKCYVAGPLFSNQDRLVLERMTAYLESQQVNVYLPHRHAGDIGSRPKNALKKRIFDEDLHNIKDADLVVCLLDGQDVDSGTCVELGIAFTLGIPIFGLKTDLWRRGGVVNNMVWGVCHSGKTIVPDFKLLSRAIAKFIRERKADSPMTNLVKG